LKHQVKFWSYSKSNGLILNKNFLYKDKDLNNLLTLAENNDKDVYEHSNSETNKKLLVQIKKLKKVISAQAIEIYSLKSTIKHIYETPLKCKRTLFFIEIKIFIGKKSYLFESIRAIFIF
jgi:hypothetical protein